MYVQLCNYTASFCSINVNLQTVKIKLNLHLPQPQHCFTSVSFFLGQQKDNLLDRTKTVSML